MDQPGNRLFLRVRSPFIVAGWIIPDPENPISRIEVRVNGEVRAVTLPGLRRQDVAAAYPDRDSLWSGFVTEILVDDLDETKIDVEVRANLREGHLTVDNFNAKVKGLERIVPPRPRNWRYPEILACPYCSSSIEEAATEVRCHGCQRQFPKRRGAPVFTNGEDGILSHLLVTNPTNPNAVDHTQIIQSEKLVLDLGAGNPRDSEHYPNVVFHEFVQYAYTDVVSTCERLPYHEGTFDAVISKAAFEHLARPWDMADEIYRVLKPGGMVRVDTAFMFPLHGDPYHFFNMTLDGAREIFKRFESIRDGVMPYQTPAHSLKAQFETMLQHLTSEEWRQRITEWKDLIGVGYALDSVIDAKGHERLAAGVFYEGRKPR